MAFKALDTLRRAVGERAVEGAVEGHRSCEDLFEGLSLVADGVTGEARCREVLSHVGACEPCRRYLESLRATREALGQSARATVLSAAEVDRLLAECRESLKARAPGLFAGGPLR